MTTPKPCCHIIGEVDSKSVYKGSNTYQTVTLNTNCNITSARRGGAILMNVVKDCFVYAPSQWETTSQCNIVSHWLSTYTIWYKCSRPWPGTWRHQMETVSALLAICAGNSPVPSEFPAQRPVTRGFDVFFDLRPNKRLSKQLWGWWFETPSRPLWCHRNEIWDN